MTSNTLFIIIFLIDLFPNKINNEMEPFIVDGISAQIEDYPHSVYLEVKCENQWICGGSILNQHIILTAGHCLYSCVLNHKTKHNIHAFVGHEILNKMTIRRKIVGITVHKYYNEKTLDNDIGLAAIDRSFRFGKNVKRVIIKHQFPTVTYAEIAGWGLIDDKADKLASRLQKLVQRLMTKRVCSKLRIHHPGMFCAGSVKFGDPRPSRGDSGSAMVTRKHQQIGIISWTSSEYPSLTVYTNVSNYYAWIDMNSINLHCKNKV